jgi:hypothetical protein
MRAIRISGKNALRLKSDIVIEEGLEEVF